MEMFLPSSVRQAKWVVLGGLLVVVMGVMRATAFLREGGLMFLIMGGLFLALGVLTVTASIMRIRRGDVPPKTERPAGSA